MYFSGFVFGGGDEVGSVGCPLEICDCHTVFVSGKIIEEFSTLRAINKELSEVGARPIPLRRIATRTRLRGLQLCTWTNNSIRLQ